MINAILVLDVDGGRLAVKYAPACGLPAKDAQVRRRRGGWGRMARHVELSAARGAPSQVAFEKKVSKKCKGSTAKQDGAARLLGSGAPQLRVTPRARGRSRRGDCGRARRGAPSGHRHHYCSSG